MTDKEWVNNIKTKVEEDTSVVEGIKGTFQFDFTKDGGSIWHMSFSGDGAVEIGEGPLADADCKITSKWEHMDKVLKGELNEQVAMMTGKMKFKGDMKTAMQLKKVLEL